MSQIPVVIPFNGTTNNSNSSEYHSIEESSQITLLSSTITFSSATQQQNTFSSNLSGTIDSLNETNSTESVGSLSNNDLSNIRIECSLSNEGSNGILNELSDEVNFSSLLYLQTKQRRIDHRRNKSEPVIRANLEDHSSGNTQTTILESSSTSTTSNESSISYSKKSSKKKINSPSTNLKEIQEKISSTKKRKSWYNPFQSTYRQRHEEFRKIFKDFPSDERLIVDYSCAWQKEILIQGRMYISANYICFHANFLKWETRLALKFEDILTITREKTAKVIPNAIEIKTNKNEKYFFASFATRDKSYAIIYQIWQTIRINQPLSSQQLWTIIHQSYGNNLDMTTDEEDNYQKESIHSTPDQKQQIDNQDSTPNSIRSKSSEKEDHSSVSSHCEEDDDIIPIGEEANTNTLIRQPRNNEEKTMEISQSKYLSKCPCQSHLSTQLIDRTYSMSVEKLFHYIFGGDTDFLRAYHQSRRIKDFDANEWKLNEETSKRERMCTYKVDVTAVFGATTISSNEKQIIDCELLNSHYIVDTEVRNEGIKYSDTFYVASRYCLIQIGENQSHLKVTCEVRYVKSVMIIIKSFIEKNATAALQDSFTDLNNRIELSISSVKRLENESNNRQRFSNNNSNEIDPIIPRRKLARKEQIIQSNDFGHRKQINYDSDRIHSDSIPLRSNSSRWSINNILIPFSLITMLILISVNIFLCIKLNEIDRMTDRLIKTPPSWFNGYEYPLEDNQWSILLKRQEEYYRTKLIGLQSILLSTHNALKNVTDALSELSKVVNDSTPINDIYSL